MGRAIGINVGAGCAFVYYRHIMTTKPLPDDFLENLQRLELAYLAETEPTRQSGFLGGESRWRPERELILDAVDEDGDFLDVGCANGYLVECLVKWSAEKGIRLIPFGVDQGPGLVKLAKKRLPKYASHFWTANAWDWTPARRFRYVYTMTDLVPEPLLKDYLLRVNNLFVEAGGKLIGGGYGSYSRNQPAPDIAAILTGFGFHVAGSATRGHLPISHVAWVEVR